MTWEELFKTLIVIYSYK